jgi:hypothetical protein
MREETLIWRRKLGLGDHTGLGGPGVVDVPAFTDPQRLAFASACQVLLGTPDAPTRWGNVAVLCEVVTSLVAGPSTAALLRAAYVASANHEPLYGWRQNMPPTIRTVHHEGDAWSPQSHRWETSPEYAAELARDPFDVQAYDWSHNLEPSAKFERVAFTLLVQNRINAANGAPAVRADTLFEGFLAAWNNTHAGPPRHVQVPAFSRALADPITRAFRAGHLDWGAYCEGDVVWLDRDFFQVQDGLVTVGSAPTSPAKGSTIAGLSLAGILTGWLVGDITGAAHNAVKRTAKGLLTSGATENPVRRGGRRRR